MNLYLLNIKDIYRGLPISWLDYVVVVADCCEATGKRSLCTDQVPPSQEGRRARATHSKHDYPTLGNQPENLINEAISFLDINERKLRQTERVGVPNNLCLHLARNEH